MKLTASLTALAAILYAGAACADDRIRQIDQTMGEAAKMEHVRVGIDQAGKNARPPQVHGFARTCRKPTQIGFVADRGYPALRDEERRRGGSNAVQGVNRSVAVESRRMRA